MFQRRIYEYLVNATITDKTLTNTEKFFVIKTLGRWFLRDQANFNPLRWCQAWNKRKQPALSLSDLSYPEESDS